ncbi:MAG: molybdopterin converting factor subunit 1 [Halioglobus sp.]|nr:molybdopterin converting factor subunit 1 [Halioglobus sp.]
MLVVRFFARVREELGRDVLEVPWTDRVADVDSLQEHLCTAYGVHWRRVLAQDNIIRAVNRAVVHGNSPLDDGDEVAFFPPVTGG